MENCFTQALFKKGKSAKLLFLTMNFYQERNTESFVRKQLFDSPVAYPDKRHEMRPFSKLGTLHPLGMNERFSYIKSNLYLSDFLKHGLVFLLIYCCYSYFVFCTYFRILYSVI